MRATYNWLKDFVEIKIAPKALAEKLTMAGLEVASLEERGGDFVFEIEVTANRPDCLNVAGIAREVAAITNSKFRAYSAERIAYRKKLSAIRYPLSAKTIKIDIKNKKDCPLYNATIIRDVKVGPSPEWLKKRLELIGCRSVNNIVDAANYILFTYGEPLHAFDLDRLQGHQVTRSPGHQVTRSPGHQLEIIIRRAKKGEEIVTIDGIKRILSENILTISAGRNELTNKPIAIAGVMGGKDTEVTEGTKNILLEAAVFNPITIRRGRQELGIQSDSSYRFERGVDLGSVKEASWRAVELIQELSKGRCVLIKSSASPKIKTKRIDLDVLAVHKMLGVNIAAVKIKKILNSLGFKPKIKTKNSFTVEIPSHRPDVNLEIDLIEEIARIHGYEFITKSLPAVKPRVSLAEKRDLVSSIKEILAGLGSNEVITYSLIDKDTLKDLSKEPGSLAIEILNPLSREQSVLRPKILPGLLNCVALNLNQKQNYLNIFEIAKVFFQEGTQAKEELALGMALCGTKSLLLAQGLIKEEAGLLHLKGILEVIFERLGIKDYSFSCIDSSLEAMVYIGNEKIGNLSQLQKAALERFDIKNKEVFALEISLDRLLSRADLKRKFAPLPIYPGVSRDISFILKEEIRAKDILEAVRDNARPLLQEVKISDYYKGKQIPSGFKGLTLSCLYRLAGRTLTEAEINPIQILVCKILTERFAVKIRA